MILQALVNYYESLAAQGKLAKPGWGEAKISFALEISEEGDLTGILTLVESVQQGKKAVEKPKVLILPEGTKRSSGVAAQFLWDNARYILGIDEAGKEERAKKCFQATAEKTQKILSKANGKQAQAIKAFLAKWNPDSAKDNEILRPYITDFLKGGNITFRIDGNYPQNDAEIIAAWDEYYASQSAEQRGICLVTGQEGPIARLHPNIKGVRGAQSLGAALVSFNAPAFESYGHEQGMNANVSEYAAFAYTTALNSLLSDKKHSQQIGDTTLVFWAEHDDVACTDCFADFLNDKVILTDEDLRGLFGSIKSGQAIYINDKLINPENKFYILGLSPNAARVSVRFFLENRFGYFLQNISRFYSDLQVAKPEYDTKEVLSLWQILQETANKNAKDKVATPLLTGAVMRSVLDGSAYPVALYQNIMLRLKAEQDNSEKFITKVSRVKAAVIKAFLLRNIKGKEDISVSLDVERNDNAYVLGRLFAVLENLQKMANPGINSTIKDRYFNSACATPAIVFPILLRLARSHEKKLSGKKGLVINIEKTITELLGRIQVIPKRLSLVDQGSFVLGYYHQVQYRYMKKEEK